MDGFLESFVSAGEDGTALANSTTATSLLPASRKITLKTSFFDRVGKRLRIRASGRISTVVTTPGTITLEARLGSVVVFNSGALALNTVAKVNVGWIYEANLVCRAIGSGTNANLLGQGFWASEAVIGSPLPTAGGSGVLILPFNTAPVAGAGFDSTAAQAVDFFATWSVANAANSIQLHQFDVESPT